MITWWMWFLAAHVFGIIEVLTITFVFLMFAIAAIAAGLVALFGGGTLAQIVVFVVVSILLIFALRPLMKGRIQRSGEDVRTNADALIGKTGYVTQLVGDRDGRIQFSGGEWSARTEGHELPVGAEVRVERIDGATAVVSALNPAVPSPTQPSAGSAS